MVVFIFFYRNVHCVNKQDKMYYCNSEKILDHCIINPLLGLYISCGPKIRYQED